MAGSDQSKGLLCTSSARLSLEIAHVFGVIDRKLAPIDKIGLVELFCRAAMFQQSFLLSQENNTHNARKVAQIPRPKETHDRPRSNVCLNFISPQLAVISDGFGKLLLAATSNRQNIVEGYNQWRLDQVDGCACPDTCVIAHASTWKRGDESVIEVIVVRVASDEEAEKSNTKDTERFRTILEWLTIGPVEDGNSSWSVERTRTLEGERAPYYAAITNNGQAIVIPPEFF